MTFRFNIVLQDTFTGEEREFMLTEGHMDTLRRALKAYKSAPAFLHERFTWPHAKPPPELIVEGECDPTGSVMLPKCENGTIGCRTHHRVRKAGTKCSACGTDGGYYTCPDSDRVAFTCHNYAGRPESVLH